LKRELLFAAPTPDVAGVVITLRALLELAPHQCGDDEEFPWPEIRAVINASIKD
jgi:hypothetical protein